MGRILQYTPSYPVFYLLECISVSRVNFNPWDGFSSILHLILYFTYLSVSLSLGLTLTLGTDSPVYSCLSVLNCIDPFNDKLSLKNKKEIQKQYFIYWVTHKGWEFNPTSDFLNMTIRRYNLELSINSLFNDYLKIMRREKLN